MQAIELGPAKELKRMCFNWVHQFFNREHDLLGLLDSWSVQPLLSYSACLCIQTGVSPATR